MVHMPCTEKRLFTNHAKYQSRSQSPRYPGPAERETSWIQCSSSTFHWSTTEHAQLYRKLIKNNFVPRFPIPSRERWMCKLWVRSLRARTRQAKQYNLLSNFIIHQTHYQKSDWSRAFNQFTIACELDMINAISAADIAFIMSSSTSAWLLSPMECSPQKQNG